MDFSATWCGPCKKISPIFEKLAGTLACFGIAARGVFRCFFDAMFRRKQGTYTTYKFAKVDVDECPETAEKCGISAMPTFQFYVDGKKVDELLGASEGALKVRASRVARCAHLTIRNILSISRICSRSTSESMLTRERACEKMFLFTTVLRRAPTRRAAARAGASSAATLCRRRLRPQCALPAARSTRTAG